MERYGGFLEYGYRFEADVASTIFDSNRAVIRAYDGRNLVDQIYFRLRKMPEWDGSLQAILLSKTDEKTLERKTEELIRRLPVLKRYL